MKIEIATDFSRVLEGTSSGMGFRKSVLLPRLREALAKGKKLEINLDGTTGLEPSFIEEAFGGLIKTNRLNYQTIVDTLIFVSDENPDYIDKILNCMEKAYNSTLQAIEEKARKHAGITPDVKDIKSLRGHPDLHFVVDIHEAFIAGYKEALKDVHSN